MIELRNEVDYATVVEKMKFLTIDGNESRLMKYDPELKGENRNKVLNRNVFYKYPKNAD